VPREIGCLRNLEFLSLTRNELVALPAEMGELEDLQCLYLSHNRLAWLPLEMEQLSPTAYISIFANPTDARATLWRSRHTLAPFDIALQDLAPPSACDARDSRRRNR
jgi:Leucine-rich repeat (LRR) protein